MSDEKVDATPPKMVLNASERVPSPPGAESNKRKTARVDLDAAQAATTVTSVKSATTRITLPTMPAAAPQGFAPKTIRLTRPGLRPAVPGPAAHVPAVSASGRIAATPIASEVAKRQTSRIPLEAAMAVPDAATGTSDVPKTLRLRRPDEEAGPGNLATTSPDASASETAPTDAQPTQRKTIRIKRPMGKNIPLAVPRSMAVARIEAEAAMRLAGDADEPVGPLWPIMAAAAILVTCVLVYALAVQAVPAWGLSFPGQVV